MSTLGDLKAEIADDLARSDLTSQIASSISYAIRLHRTRPFWWTKDRSTTFSTTADKANYTSSDVAALGNIIALHRVLATRTTGKSRLVPMHQDELEIAAASGTIGFPSFYSWYDGVLWLSPTPDDTYTVQVLADLIESAPATDGETGNRWMTHAYGLIRAEAKRYLAKHVLRDRSLDEDMQQEVNRELLFLVKESNRHDATGRIEGDQDFFDDQTPYWLGAYGRRW